MWINSIKLIRRGTELVFVVSGRYGYSRGNYTVSHPREVCDLLKVISTSPSVNNGFQLFICAPLLDATDCDQLRQKIVPFGSIISAISTAWVSASVSIGRLAPESNLFPDCPDLLTTESLRLELVDRLIMGLPGLVQKIDDSALKGVLDFLRIASENYKIQESQWETEYTCETRIVF